MSEVKIMIKSQKVYDKNNAMGCLINNKFFKDKEAITKEQLLDVIFNSVNVGISVIDEEGNYQIVNCAYCNILGYTSKELAENSFTMIIPPENREYAMEIHKAFIRGENPNVREWKMVKKSGELLDVYVTSTLLIENCEEKYRVSTVVDITETKSNHEKLNLFAQMLTNTKEGIIITSSDPTNIIYVNEAFCKTTGFTGEEVVEKANNILIEGFEGNEFYNNMWKKLKKHGIWQGEVRGERKNKEKYTAFLTINSIKDTKGVLTNYVAIIDEKADTKKYEERIRYLSTYDSLTNLPKRHVFENTLRGIVNNKESCNQKIAVLMVDLDWFKNINDTYGLNVGNKLLSTVGSRIKNIIKDSNFSAYLGEDHFAVLFANVLDMNDITIIANKISSSIKKTVIIDNNEINITCSIGISIFPDETENIEDLILHAEKATAEAKRQNRDCIQFYTQELNNKLSRRFRIENDLKTCIRKNELFLVYQPQIDLSTNKMVGVEALLRWRHPTLGLIPPNEFIQIAETTGIILPIGEWVFRTACEQAKQWKDKGILSFKVAVNFSYIQLKQENICETIKNIIEETGIGSDTIEIELTESTMMQDIDKSIDVFNQLKHIGIKISIDDFGTGYSSLSYLRKIPINKLKIDRSFIMDLGNDFESSVITKTIIDMAKNLRFRVIAEGAETKEHIEYLKENGCHEVQGYYFSKPLLPEDLEKFMEQL